MKTRFGTLTLTIAVATAAVLATATSAGAGSAFTLSVEPTQLILVGTSRGFYTVRNPTKSPVTLNARVGNYTIKPNGRVVIDPKVPSKRSAKRWVTISPKKFTVKAKGKVELKVHSHPGKKTGPGDHPALVLFVSATRGKGNVLIRTRVGVGVLVRVKGKIRRRLAITGLSTARSKHQLRLTIANRGNINERLLSRKVKVSLKRGKRTIQTLSAPARQVLPHSRTVYTLHYRSGLKGKLAATVTVRPANGAIAGAFAPPLKQVKRTFHVRF